MRFSSRLPLLLSGTVLAAGVGPLAAQLPDSLRAPVRSSPQEAPNSPSAPDSPPSPLPEPGAAALDARLSPDGLRIVFRAPGEDRMELRVLGVGEPPEAARSLGDGSIEPGESYAWTPDQRGIVFRSAADGHLYVAAVDAPDLDGAASTPRDLTPGIEGSARLAGFTQESDAALVELPGRDGPDAPDLYRIDLSSGERARIAENDGMVRRWMPDARGVPRVAVRGSVEGSVEVVRVRGDTITPIHTCAPGELCEPLALHPDGRIWVRSSRARSAPALILLDRITHEEEVVRPDLSGDPDAVFRNDSTFQQASALLGEHLPDAKFEFQRPEAGGALMLVTASDSVSRMLHLFDRWSGDLTRLLPLRSDDAARLTAEREAGAIPDPDRLAPATLDYRQSTNEEGGRPTEVRRTIDRPTIEHQEERREVWRVVDQAQVPVYEDPPIDTEALEDPDFEPDITLPSEATGMADAEDTVLLDGHTLRPISRRMDGPFTIRLDFEERRIAGEAASSGFTIPIELSLDQPVWSDGSALELLVAALPIRDGFQASFRVFDAEIQDTVTLGLSAEDAAPVRVEAGEFEVWRLTVAAVEGSRPEETWYVRRAAPHYLVRSTLRADDFVRTIELIDAGGSR